MKLSCRLNMTFLFSGKSMQLKDLKADYGFLTMKRNGEWVCPVKSCDYRLFKVALFVSLYFESNAMINVCLVVSRSNFVCTGSVGRNYIRGLFC